MSALGYWGQKWWGLDGAPLSWYDSQVNNMSQYRTYGPTSVHTNELFHGHNLQF